MSTLAIAMPHRISALLRRSLVITALIGLTTSGRAETSIKLDGLEFPSHLADAVWQDATNFETELKGNGSGISYSHSKRKIDVFVYYSQAHGTVKQRIAAEMNNVVLIMDSMMQRGYYSDVQIGEARTEIVEGAEFAFRSVSFLADGKRKVSGYFMGSFGELIVKLRVTADATDSDVVSGFAFQPYVKTVAQIIKRGQLGRSF